MSNKPKISIIIAVYNAEMDLDLCLKSIFESEFKDFEVLVIDDCSTDNTVDVAKRYPVRLFSTGENSGPSTARNIGVNEANSDILFFLDADTKMEKDTLGELHGSFLKNPEISGVIGLPNIKTLGSGYASGFQAFRNNYLLYSANEKSDYFTTQMGAIKKDILVKIGGFDTRFKKADVEDILIGLKVPRGSILIDKGIIIAHRFPGFRSMIKNYYRRTKLLVPFVKKYKKMNSAHSNIYRTLSVLSVLISLLLLPLIIFDYRFLVLFGLVILIFLLFNVGFFVFVAKKGSIYLAFIYLIIEYLSSISIGVGGIVGSAKAIFKT